MTDDRDVGRLNRMLVADKRMLAAKQRGRDDQDADLTWLLCPINAYNSPDEFLAWMEGWIERLKELQDEEERDDPPIPDTETVGKWAR